MKILAKSVVGKEFYIESSWESFRRYDTDTAKKIGSWDNRDSVTSHSFIRETLYRKRTGEYFLCGYGVGNQG